MEEETIATYFQRVDDVVNAIRGIEYVYEKIIVQKALRTLPLRFNPKVCSIEEMRNLKKMAMDELHGILIAYQMRIEDPTPKEETFMERNNKKAYSYLSSHFSEEYEEMANFVWKLKS